MINKQFAQRFAKEWIAAWNAQDMDRILAHYDDDFEMSSPIIVLRVGEESGKLKGKAAVGAYWTSALESYPDLHFELIDVFLGVDSIVIYYDGVRGASAEVFHFNELGKVSHAFANYSLDS